MSGSDNVMEKLRPIIERYFQGRSREFCKEDSSVPLVDSTYGSAEVIEALESMMSTYVTKGEKVEKFESRWSEYIDVSNGVMANSGSSANLIALKALSQDFSKNSEVIVPAVGWSTTYFPIIDTGAKPVFVDVKPEEFMMDIDAVKSAITENTEAIMPVHILGNPGPMDAITDLCEDHDIALLEDCAEAHGAEFNGRKVGSFGDISTFSFSFSHHITTTEGGMAVTDSEEYSRRMKMLRSWGRVRDVEKTADLEQKAGNIDLDFMFASHGYNVRPTEIQGAFGMHQVKKVEGFVSKRRDIAAYLNKRLRSIDGLSVMEERSGTKCSYLHYPLLLDGNSTRGRKELMNYLERNGIETRPILSGNITRHPAFNSGPGRSKGDLKGADRIHDKGVYISNHHYLTEEHLDYIVRTVRSFFRN